MKKMTNLILKDKQEIQRIATRKLMMKIKLQTTNDKPITSSSRFTIYCQAKKVKEVCPKHL